MRRPMKKEKENNRALREEDGQKDGEKETEERRREGRKRRFNAAVISAPFHKVEGLMRITAAR
jgi:hypothetical protein